jgi:hypothetical protein
VPIESELVSVALRAVEALAREGKDTAGENLALDAIEGQSPASLPGIASQIRSLPKFEAEPEANISPPSGSAPFPLIKHLVKNLVDSDFAFGGYRPRLSLNLGRDRYYPEFHYGRSSLNRPSIFGSRYGEFGDESPRVFHPPADDAYKAPLIRKKLEAMAVEGELRATGISPSAVL